MDENGCSVYNTPPSNTNWAQSFGLYPNGTLCFIKNQDRLFQLDSFVFCASFDIDDTTPPDGCSCSTPQDIVFGTFFFHSPIRLYCLLTCKALDRSSSILTSSTYLYREFIQNFVDRYTFDPLSPSTSTQMGIVQYGILFSFFPPFRLRLASLDR